MKERIFLLLLVLCHLVVTEEASAKEEKVDGEKDQGGGGNSVTMDHDKKGRMANKESEKSESETRGPPRLRKAMEVVVGKVSKFSLFHGGSKQKQLNVAKIADTFMKKVTGDNRPV